MKQGVAGKEAAGVARAPDVVIRIAPDGRVYFHDITGPILDIARSLAPDDAALNARVAAKPAGEKEIPGHG